MYIRGTALECLSMLVITNRIPRKIVIDYLESLLKRGLENKPKERFIGRHENMFKCNDILLMNGCIISECYNLCAIELQSLIKKSFDERIVDENYVCYEKDISLSGGRYKITTSNRSNR